MAISSSELPFSSMMSSSLPPEMLTPSWSLDPSSLLPMSMSKEAGNAAFSPSQEKFNAVVLRGVGNVSGAP